MEGEGESNAPRH